MNQFCAELLLQSKNALSYSRNLGSPEMRERDIAMGNTFFLEYYRSLIESRQ